MKKRVLSLLLSTVMLLSVLSMAGCSSTKTETSEPAQSRILCLPTPPRQKKAIMTMTI